ncbi:MAG: nitroreductase family protein [Deferribacterota bacterium]|nr:nitroreductase family protein [Deferribacterota bacterium]
MEEILLPIENWASIRKYKEKDIPEDVVKRILNAARLAPSWANTQPWHFIIVKDKSKKDLLRKLALNQNFINQADVIIVCCADFLAWKKENRLNEMQKLWEALGRSANQEVMNKYLENPVINPALRGEQILLARQYEQLSFAIAFMILQAKHEGIGSCIIGGFCNPVTGGDLDLYKKVAEALNLPEHLLVLTMVTLGYPAENPKKRPRKSFDDIVSFEVYGKKY